MLKNGTIQRRKNHLQGAGQTESSQTQEHPNLGAFPFKELGGRVGAGVLPLDRCTGQGPTGCFLLRPHTLQGHGEQTFMKGIIQRLVAKTLVNST